MARAYNFSAGPAILPTEVLLEAQRDLLDFKGTGMSIMEMSHRGKEYTAVHEEAVANLKTLLKVPDNYSILFMTGGATSQFSFVPMNLLGAGQSADYINAGSWGAGAVKAAKKLGKINVIADTSKEIPTRMPANSELKFTDGAAYVHITSNETIAGTQVKEFPKTKAPLVADMSSDILSRPIDVSQFGIIYAGAQKNLAPAGVTLVIIRNDLAELAPKETLPELFQYRAFIEENSLKNTPPTFPIYIIMLVTRWLMAKGGLEGMQKINDAKAAKLYAAIDASSFYKGTAVKEYRSPMNVTFRLPTEELEESFIKAASKLGMTSLKGHRSVGGIRASIYNAFPMEGIDALVAFMKDFEAKNS